MGAGGTQYAYYHEEDESTFQLVDTSRSLRGAYGRGRFFRGRGAFGGRGGQVSHVAKRFFNIVTDAPGVSVVETSYGRNIRMFVISWRLSLARLSSLVKCLREWLECNQVKQISGAKL
jgi:hypothetical protein